MSFACLNCVNEYFMVWDCSLVIVAKSINDQLKTPQDVDAPCISVCAWSICVHWIQNIICMSTVCRGDNYITILKWLNQGAVKGGSVLLGGQWYNKVIPCNDTRSNIYVRIWLDNVYVYTYVSIQQTVNLCTVVLSNCTTIYVTQTFGGIATQSTLQEKH